MGLGNWILGENDKFGGGFCRGVALNAGKLWMRTGREAYTGGTYSLRCARFVMRGRSIAKAAILTASYILKYIK